MKLSLVTVLLFKRAKMLVLYVTDKVFDPTCSTQKVYEEGAKNVALSALTGINGKYV